MRSDFAIFILSHGRANEMTTLNAILDAGYSGSWYIVVDDLDEQREEYIEKYGEKVIVFDKKEWAEKTDTVTVTGELRSVVFARNACYEIAEQLGLKYFAEFDDDLISFYIRYEQEGKLMSHRLQGHFDDMIDGLIDFQAQSGALSVGIASDGIFWGGATGYGNAALYGISTRLLS